MIDQLLFTGALMVPELIGAAAEGAKSLAVSAGTEIGKGIVKGIASEVRNQANEMVGMAKTADEEFANEMAKAAASRMADAGADLMGGLFRKA